jgi:TonB family protein
MNPVRSRLCRTCFLLIGLFAIQVGVAGAQKSDAATRIRAAATQSSLESVSQKPWHLKLDVTVYDETGKNPRQGTAEVWHADGDERRVETFGDSSRTFLRHEGKSYVKSAGPELPFFFDEAVKQTLHSGPTDRDLEGSKPELKKQRFGNVEFDCIMLTQSSMGPVPLGLFPTYCLDSSEIIRSSYNFGGQTIVVSGVGMFLGHDIPMKLDLLEGQTVVATAKIVSLASYLPQADEFAATADMTPLGGEVRISGSMIAGHRLTFVQPVYPPNMKADHVAGTVVLRALIGRDGHIRSLRPVSANDPEFVISAIAAVRQWTYTPYLLNGLPTDVDTTITVNYALNKQ